MKPLPSRLVDALVGVCAKEVALRLDQIGGAAGLTVRIKVIEGIRKCRRGGTCQSGLRNAVGVAISGPIIGTFAQASLAGGSFVPVITGTFAVIETVDIPLTFDTALIRVNVGGTGLSLGAQIPLKATFA